MIEDPREWLEPDGLGGYAMGCVDGVRTRRYHSFLLAATRPPEGRMVLVADLEVFVETTTGRQALSSHRYRGDAIHPDGRAHLASFTHRPYPRWEWALPDGTRIACELAVARGTPRTHLKWQRLAGAGPARLWLRPLLAGRDYHALHHENAAFRMDAEVRAERVTWRPYDGVPAISALANARYEHAPDWYRAFLYSAERDRGLDDEEDLAAPGVFLYDLAAAPAALVLAADDPGDRGALAAVDGVLAARARAGTSATLADAAEAYVSVRAARTEPSHDTGAKRGDGETIVAGYPWFADWGRDTFVSLRGLCLATGRRELARRILAQWATQVSEGMLPNRYCEHDDNPEYNSVDASLWFVIAADAVGRDPETDRAILDIVDGYARGTRHRIGATDDGLLACGVPGLQLTWMDAKVGDEVITPRIGKPVEIQALWCNALAIAGQIDLRWSALEHKARAAFAARFWNGQRGQLYDVVDVDHQAGVVDATCRPNQILAVGGLPRALVTGARAHAVVDAVERALVTPAGVRSLAPDEPRYHGRYRGGPAERDRSYHDGAVWPWLIGPFVEAWVRVRGNTVDAKREARARFLAPLLDRVELAGLGHLSEICDGDPPHEPRGCPFQAWSVAEALRLDRDVLAE